MRIKYYDTWEFRHIFDLVETDPMESKIQFEEYLKMYPLDYTGYTYYVYVLITLGHFKEAEEILNKISNIYINDQNFIRDKKKVRLMRENIIMNTLKILAYQERYEEVIEYRRNNNIVINDFNFHSLDFYANHMLGNKCLIPEEKLSYLFKQIVYYSDERFFEHIKKHLADYNEGIDTPCDSVFVPEFPINKVIEEVKKHVGSDKRLYPGYFENVYVFKYNECGRVNNRLVNYFKVIALNNLDHFITIFPASQCENLPFIDLNYLIPEKEDVKVKRLSQTDKFNQRYKINR